MTQQISEPVEATGAPPTPLDGGERSARQRKRGIYFLTGVCVAFFVIVIAACYVAAGAYGYGSGFGDGKELPDRIPTLSGTGFWGDLGLLAGGFALDLVIMYAWYLAASRMDNPSIDDPVAPDLADVDLNDAESWYVVQVPGLTKTLMGVAIFCLVAIVIGVSAVLPVVTIRYGWIL